MLTEFQTTKLTHWFGLYDRNGDGFIDEADVMSYARSLIEIRGIEGGAAEAKEVLADQLGWWNQLVNSGADANEDGRLSLEEVLGFWAFVNGAAAAEAAEGKTDMLEQMDHSSDATFSLLDLDRDGVISREEFTIYLRSLGTTSGFDQTFDALDLDGNGSLSRDETRILVRQFYLGTDPSEPGTHLYGRIG